MLIPGFSNNPAAFQWGSRFFIGMNTQKFYSLKKKNALSVICTVIFVVD